MTTLGSVRIEWFITCTTSTRDVVHELVFLRRQSSPDDPTCLECWRRHNELSKIKMGTPTPSHGHNWCPLCLAWNRVPALAAGEEEEVWVSREEKDTGRA